MNYHILFMKLILFIVEHLENKKRKPEVTFGIILVPVLWFLAVPA